VGKKIKENKEKRGKKRKERARGRINKFCNKEIFCAQYFRLFLIGQTCFMI